ncbi:MAG: hypothetical protein K6U78_17160 [Anaerolineae bacterium]|nr:hypothetical protein [Anaerolineae bacterium]
MVNQDWLDKRRVLSNGLTFLAWLATVGLGLVVLYALRQMSFGLFALLGLDVRTAQLASLWLILVLALGWLAFVVVSGEYHRRRVGQLRAVQVFAVTLAIELVVIALYLVF